MLQGFYYYYYYYLAWSITATVEPRGICHRKGKDITFTVKKSLYMMSFPPSFPSRGGSDAEPEPVVLAQGGGGSCDAAWCFWVCKSRVHPSPFLCRVLSIFFFPLGGKKKKRKRCYPKNCRLQQQSSAVEHMMVYHRIQLLTLARALSGNSGKVRKGCTFLSATDKPYINVCTHVCVCLGHVILLR